MSRPARKVVKMSQLSTISMTTGGERKHPLVVMGGRLQRWVGFGWVDEGKATQLDKKRYPKVVDN